MEAVMGIILWLIFGAIVGWLAGIIMKSKNGLIWNVILGIVGSFVGGFIAQLLGFGGMAAGFNIINALISIGGACLVIIVVRALRLIK